jgi:hypothetical protein
MSVQPNNGKIAQTNFRLKSMKKNSPKFVNNVPGVLRLILNAKGFDFESLKLKLSAIFSYRDLDLTS